MASSITPLNCQLCHDTLCLKLFNSHSPKAQLPHLNFVPDDTQAVRRFTPSRVCSAAPAPGSTPSSGHSKPLQASVTKELQHIFVLKQLLWLQYIFDFFIFLQHIFALNNYFGCNMGVDELDSGSPDGEKTTQNRRGVRTRLARRNAGVGRW